MIVSMKSWNGNMAKLLYPKETRSSYVWLMI